MKKSVPFLLFLLFCVSCNSAQGLAPKNIINTVFSFYQTKIASSQEEEYLDTNVIYHFQNDGTYVNSIKGKIVDRGSYSYRVMKDPNQASIMFTYVVDNQSYIYDQIMYFDTTTRGTWELFRTTDPKINGVEKGTFELLSTPAQ